jgi:hypothetical protein
MAAALAVVALPAAAGPAAARSGPERIVGSAAGRVTGETLTLHLRDGSLGPGKGAFRFSAPTRVRGSLRLSRGTLRIAAELRLTLLPPAKRPSPARMALRARARITGGTRRYRRARGSFVALGTLNAYTGRFTVHLDGSYRR